ncbi:MAG: hypothetical protein GTN81_09170 [Proteobacteria bacterium]|nr:hypothetical protein [Pseudomonadota bacterium]
MYLKPFFLIQILAFLTTEIWGYARLRAFGLAFMTKLEALAASSYIPIPLPNEFSAHLHAGSLAQAGMFFAFTLGFTLGVIAFAGSLSLHRFKVSKPIRLGWTIFISVLLSFLVGFSPLGLLLLIAFFGVAHFLIRIPEAPFHKVALLSLVPLIMVLFVFQEQGFLGVRDYLLQNSWGTKVVAFYYRYSPISAELITPPKERTQVTIWTGASVMETEKSWLLKRGLYTVSTREAADLALPSDLRTGPAILKSVETWSGGGSAQRLRRTTFYSIFLTAPLAIMLFVVLATDSLLALSKYSRIVVLTCVALFSALLIYSLLPQKVSNSRGPLPAEKVEEIRSWVISEKKTRNPETRKNFIKHLNSANPAVRLWAAEALAYLPSKQNVEMLTNLARKDPVPIVRCKAILALSFQGERRMIPILESWLRGKEDWYVKHYLFRALRRLGWNR